MKDILFRRELCVFQTFGELLPFIVMGLPTDSSTRAMNRDCDVYGENADDFEPSRYLNAKGSIEPTLVDTKGEGHVTFGFGRR